MSEFESSTDPDEIVASVDTSNFEVDVVDAKRVPDTHIGNWHVKLSNNSSSDATLLITAVSSIGTTITETTDSCSAVAAGWECDIPANDDLEITLSTSLEHICDNNRVRVTVSASVDGQGITVSNHRRLVRHRELSCPSITLANPTYDTSASSASWSVTVQRRLFETDPGIDITFDDGVSFSELPDYCAATQSVVTCHVASFDNSHETFKATQTIAQTCSLKQHIAIADARFADDNAIVPVSPSTGLKIEIPAINPCVTQSPSPTPTPTPTPSPTPTATNTPTPTPTFTPTHTPSPTPTATNTPTPTPTFTPTHTPSPTPTATNTPTPTPTFTPTHTPSPTPTATNTPTPTPTFTPTHTPSPTPTATNTPSPTATVTPSPTPTEVPATLTVMFEKLIEDDLTLSWMFDQMGVPEPTSYKVGWKDTSLSTEETIVTLLGTVNEYTIADISADVRYEIRVIAIYNGEERYVGRTALRLNVPRKPTVEPIEKTDSSIKLRWKDPIVDTGTLRRPVDGYEFLWRVTGSPGLEVVKLGKDVREHLVDGLISGTSYDVSLFAKNGLGNGEAFSISVETDGVAPTLTPTPTPTFTPTPTPTPTATPTPTPLPGSIIVQFDSLTNEGAKVGWYLETPVQVEPTHYEVSWTSEINNVWKTSGLLPSTASAYTIPNIAERTKYDIKAAALNNGTELSARMIALKFDVPVEPKVQIESVTETTIYVRWTLPVPNPRSVIQRPVTEYELSWKEDVPDAKVMSVVLGAKVDFYIITQLSPDAKYAIALMPSNPLGSGTAKILSRSTAPSVTSTPASTPTVQTPVLTPTAISTPTVTPTVPVTSGATLASSRNKRDTDPDPPEEFDAEQGDSGIVFYWDDPRWDGGSEILAYAVDWHPESPPFPLFLPPTERSTWIYGLKPDINYRMRVRAFNHKEDSLPATLRVKLTDTLVRYRSFAPFTGSISNARSTVLKNNSELPSFEIQSDSKTLFWGDQMVFSIQRYPPEAELITEMKSRQFATVSDIFTVVASPHSRRSRFDNDATSYQFVVPVVICITPNLLDSVPIRSYSIAQILSPANIRVFDSAPVQEDDEIKICARIREIDLNRNVAFAVISNQLALQTNADSTRHEGGAVGNAAIALVMFVVGPTLILGGLKMLRQSPPPLAKSS